MRRWLVGVWQTLRAGLQVPFYERRNRDLPPMSPSGRWSHFVMFGQFEGRPFRFKCNAERQAPLPVPGAHLS